MSGPTRPSACDIEDAQSHPLAATPAIERQLPSDMGALAAQRHDRFPERPARGAEGERFERSTIVSRKAETQVPCAHLGDFFDAVTRHDDHRLRIAGAKRTRLLDQMYNF